MSLDESLPPEYVEAWDRVERELRCPICLATLERPQFLPCGHNFCEECILQSLKVSTACPCCKVPCWKRQLQFNTTIANIVESVLYLNETAKDVIARMGTSTKEVESLRSTVDWGKGSCTQIEDEIKRLQATCEDSATVVKENEREIESIQKKIEKKSREKKKLEDAITQLHENILKRKTRLEERRVQRGRIAKTRKAEQLRDSIRKSGKRKEVKDQPRALQQLDIQAVNARTDISSKPGVVRQSMQTTRSDRDAERIQISEHGHPVVITTALSIEEMDTVKEVARLLGFSISRKFMRPFTHIVTSVDENNRAQRTIKFSTGILNGAYIVSFQWILACKKAGALVSEEPFEVAGDVRGVVAGGPKLGRQSIAAGKPPLFSGYEFYLHGTFGARLPRKEEMTHLIAIGGGKVLSRMPSRREAAQNLFVIVDNETLTQKAFDEIKSKDLTIVMGQWLLDSISAYSILDPHQFKGFPLLGA